MLSADGGCADSSVTLLHVHMAARYSCEKRKFKHTLASYAFQIQTTIFLFFFSDTFIYTVHDYDALTKKISTLH